MPAHLQTLLLVYSSHINVNSPGFRSDFTNFHSVSQDTIQAAASKLSMKSCNLDLLPASLMKNYLHLLLPILTKIVNMSLSSGKMPEALKVAELKPVLKNLDADYRQFSNFWPISNLKMISKVVEKGVAMQLMDHVTSHQLDEWLQSAYKLNHSTETALVRVQNDILCS